MAIIWIVVSLIAFVLLALFFSGLLKHAADIEEHDEY
jgi:hypothetical protein